MKNKNNYLRTNAKKQAYKNKGITLIALIITIVIMLILVAVSVNVLINSNIIGQAEKAAKGYKTAYEQEQTRIDELMEKWNRLEQDQCAHTWGEENITKAATCTETGTKTRTCTKCGKVETVTIQALGHNLVNGVCTRCGANFGIPASDVANKPSIYGSTVTNYNANGIEWKVFYATTDRIYLIASDFVHYSKLTNAYKNGARCYNTDTRPYSYCWEHGSTSLEATGRQDGIFMATGYTLNSRNINSKCVSGLLNTNNWTAFVDTNYADYAIGGPTLNMYIASWNAKGYTTLYTKTDANGYYVDTSPNIKYSYHVKMSSDTAGYGDTLYYPHQSPCSKCNGYCLAAPSALSTSGYMGVYYNGDVNECGDYLGNLFGVRPLVSLKSGVTLLENINGTVTLKK